MNQKRAIQVYEGSAVWPDGQYGLVNIRLMVCEQNEHEYVQCLAAMDEVDICSPRSPYYFIGEQMVVYRFDTDRIYRTVKVGPAGSDICDFICHGLVPL